MPRTLARSFAAVVSSESAGNNVPVPWQFGLLLLGLAAALTILAAAYPEFFVGASTHFGPDTP